MRLVVRLIPEHHRFDHQATSPLERNLVAATSTNSRAGTRTLAWQRWTSSSGCAMVSNPALRSIASTQARFGIHQFVGSSAYLPSTKWSRGKPGESKTTHSEKG